MKNWASVVALKDVADVFNGKTPSKAEQRNEGHPVLKIRDVSELGKFRGNHESFVDPLLAAKYSSKQVQEGDTLILNAAHNADYVGSKTYRAELPAFGALATGEWLIIRPSKGRLDAGFANHWVTSKSTKLAIRNVVNGIHLYPKDVARLDIPLPPLPEQRRIAAILDQADALRAKRREALAQLDSLTQSIFIEMFGELSTNSKGWQTCTVGDISDCIVPGRDKPKSFSGGIPWVTTADLQHLEFTLGSSKKIGLSDTEIKDVRARVIPSGSVIISCVGDLGIVSIAEIPMVVNQQLHSFQCHKNFNNIFLMYCLALQKPFMLAKASSTTLPYMNKTVCNSIPVVIPPLILQQTFAARIQAVEALKAVHRTSLAELDTLFASLQHRAFQGEL